MSETPGPGDGGAIMDEDYREIQVVMTPGIQGPFREWLASRGLYLFPIPVEDDLPTYGIGVIGGVTSGGGEPVPE